MMNPELRNKTLNTIIAPVVEADAPEVRVIGYPNHITIYVMQEEHMDRQAHTLINDKRAAAPALPRAAIAKSKEAMFAMKTLKSAELSADKIEGPAGVIIQVGRMSPLEYRSDCPPGDYNTRLLVEMIASTSPLAETIQAAMDIGLSEVAGLMLDTSNKEELDAGEVSLLRKLNSYYTSSINTHIKSVIDPTLSIDSFMDDYDDLIVLLEDKGFMTADVEFNSLLTVDAEFNTQQVPEEEGLLVCSGKCILIRLDKTGTDLGFVTITSDIPVMLSSLTHSSLLEVLDRLYTFNDHVPLVHLQLLDDDFLCHKSMVWGGTWSVVRAA